MTYEAQRAGKVKGVGEIYRVDAPLDEQLRAFAKVGITTLTTPEEVAQMRLSGIKDSWSRTSIAPIAVKGARTILFRNSPLMNPFMAASAVKAHRNNQYLQVGKEVYDFAEETAKAQSGLEPEDREAIIVSGDGDFPLTLGMDETRFSLGRTAQPYFEKFVQGGKDGKIDFYNLTGVSKDIATLNYLWFSDPQGGSYLGARYRDLYDDDGAFGVLRAGVASAQKNGYSLTEIQKANSEIVPVVLNTTGLSGLTSTLSKPLTKGLLDKLRESK